MPIAQSQTNAARRSPLAALLVSTSLAAALAGPVAAAESPVVATLLTSDYVVAADGTYVQLSHAELRAANTAAAREVAQQVITYSEALADLEIVEAYTLKADGSKIPVAKSAIFTQAQKGSAGAEMFSDQKQKVIVFPKVAAGDSVVYTVRESQKHPLFAGAFTASDAFPRTLSIKEMRGTITAPRALPLAVEGHGIDFEKSGEGDSVVYRWRFSQPDALTEDAARVSDFDRNTRYFVSTFADYDSFARDYAALVAPAERVTADIAAAAEEITEGAKDRREQAAQIYNWVSTHIRYVGIELGRGAVEPHSAETVLANGYGDCKDHAVLFAALLKAKGIDSHFVLVNADNAYTLSANPTLAQLNHAISYLPEFDLYADTTAGTTSFGALPFTEYGKPVVHAIAEGNALRRIPLLAPGAAKLAVSATNKLDGKGRLTGEMLTEGTGPYAGSLRSMAQVIEARGSKASAAGQLRALGLSGKGDFETQAPDDLSGDFAITASYQLDPLPEVLTGAAFPMPAGMRLMERTGDLLMGPLLDTRLADDAPTPCYSGSAREELSLELPAGMRLAKLPADTLLANANMTFSAHWQASGRTVSVVRQMTTAFDAPLCAGDTRKAAAQALRDIRDSYNTQLALAVE